MFICVTAVQECDARDDDSSNTVGPINIVIKIIMRLITLREKEVLQLLALGLSYGKIALRMNVKQETIKMHLKNIYRKLNAKNKIEALQKVKLL